MINNQLEEDFQAFFNGLEGLLVFCDEKSVSCNIGDAEFCQEGIHVAICFLHYIISSLPIIEETSDLLENLHALVKCFSHLKETWDSI